MMETRDRATLRIDFLYLDNRVCDRCRGTEAALDEALERLRPVVEATGVELQVYRHHVTSAAQAERLGMRSSPTVLIDGHDAAAGLEETPCGSCTDLAAGAGVRCRSWSYAGTEHDSAPVGLLVDAVLRVRYQGASALGPRAGGPLPNNLRAFFERTDGGAACCGPACCGPDCCRPVAEA